MLRKSITASQPTAFHPCRTMSSGPPAGQPLSTTPSTMASNSSGVQQQQTPEDRRPPKRVSQACEACRYVICSQCIPLPVRDERALLPLTSPPLLAGADLVGCCVGARSRDVRAKNPLARCARDWGKRVFTPMMGLCRRSGLPLLSGGW